MADEIDRPSYRRVAAEIGLRDADPEARASLCEMLIILSRHVDLVFGTLPDHLDTPFVRGLIKMHDRRKLWLRPLADWRRSSKNTGRQFGELARHLFDRFCDVPRFMEATWLRADRPSWRYRDWFVHLGRGHNLRRAKAPVTITKKIAHEFLRAPDDYTIEQAVRWGQLRAFGAGSGVCDAVAATRLGRPFANEAFWVTVQRFFAENPMLDPRQIGPIVECLQTNVSSHVNSRSHRVTSSAHRRRSLD